MKEFKKQQQLDIEKFMNCLKFKRLLRLCIGRNEMNIEINESSFH